MSPLTRITLLLTLLLGIVGCASDQQIVAQASDMHKQLRPAIITDRELQAYVQTLGNRVVDQARVMATEGNAPKAHFSEDSTWMFSEVQFHLVNSKTLNAFTTGGQHVYLYTELFRQSKTEDEFAAVVAHEFAHIYARHVHNGMNRQYMVLGAAAAAGVAGYALGGENREEIAIGAAGIGLVGGQFWGMGYGRKDEDEADKYGFRMYVRAGWNPDLFGDFFQQMIDKGYDKGPEFASSHPRLANRVEAAKRRTSEWRAENANWESYRKRNVASVSEFKRLQKRALSVGQSMPNDESLQAAQLMFSAFPSCVAPTDQKSQVEAREELLEAVDEKK
jgi:predicted Zn-dependent protease